MVANYIPDHIIDLVRDSADMVEIISQYVKLRRTGRNWVGLCPFHSEKTPSFSVSPEKGIFYCFGCGKGGNIFKFLMEFEDYNFVQSVRYLAERYHVSIPETTVNLGSKLVNDENLEKFYKLQEEALEFFLDSFQSIEGKPCREYLETRGISAGVMETFQLGYAPDKWDGFVKRLKSKGYSLELAEQSGLIIRNKEGTEYHDRFRGRLMFPIHNISGRIEAFGGRSIKGETPKYMNSPETPIYKKGQTLYGLYRAKQKIRQVKYAMIVEGYMDLIALASVGIYQVVATLGTALTIQQVRLLKKFTGQVALIFDTDDAGVKATLRGIETCLETGLRVKVVNLPGEKDPDDFIREKGVKEFKSVFKSATEGIEFVFNYYLSQPNAMTPHGKPTLVGQVATYLAKIKDSIARNEYVRLFAEKINVDEQLLVNKLIENTRRQGKYNKPATEHTQHDTLDNTEKLLVQCMIIQPELVETFFSKMEIEELTNPQAKLALESLANELKNSVKFNPAKLMDHFSKYLPDSVVSNLPITPADNQDDQQDLDMTNITLNLKMFNDCLVKIRKRFLQQQMHEINVAMKEAKKAGNQELVDSLFRKKFFLGKKIINGDLFSDEN